MSKQLENIEADIKQIIDKELPHIFLDKDVPEVIARLRGRLLNQIASLVGHQKLSVDVIRASETEVFPLTINVLDDTGKLVHTFTLEQVK